MAMLRDWLDTELAEPSAIVLKAGSPDLAVATSKTFRSLARLTGAAPSAAGPGQTDADRQRPQTTHSFHL
ncbi:putative exopolyphosphatase [Mycobacterium xenopi 3993]|nr:putative exopolyphosphatase [Mycobacterium xenopi 3993]